MHSGATRVEYNDRKEAIMEAAIKVFATLGYHRATTADVSREAGISQQYIYRFFATKEALFLEIVELIYRRIEQEFVNIEAEREDLLGLLVAAYERIMAKYPCEMRLQVQTLGIQEEAVQQIVRSAYLRIKNVVQKKFEAVGLDEAETAAKDFLARGMLCNVAFVLDSQELTYV